jgi:hypothetical protein
MPTIKHLRPSPAGRSGALQHGGARRRQAHPAAGPERPGRARGRGVLSWHQRHHLGLSCGAVRTTDAGRTSPDIVAKGNPQAAVNQFGLVRDLRGPSSSRLPRRTTTRSMPSPLSMSAASRWCCRFPPSRHPATTPSSSGTRTATPSAMSAAAPPGARRAFRLCRAGLAGQPARGRDPDRHPLQRHGDLGPDRGGRAGRPAERAGHPGCAAADPSQPVRHLCRATAPRSGVFRCARRLRGAGHTG